MTVIALAACDGASPPDMVVERTAPQPVMPSAPTRAADAQPAAPSPTNDAQAITPTPTIAAPPTPTPDPLDAFAADLRPAFVADLAANRDLPRYWLRLWLNPAERTMTGTVEIRFPNTTGESLDDVALRLYPNFPRDLFGKGGDVRMDVTGAAVDGQPVVARYTAERTAVLLPLPRPLAPGSVAQLALSFTATIVPWRDGTWPLPSYYPMLAMREGAAWRLDVTRFPDRVFSAGALYDVEVTVPVPLVVVTSGAIVGTREQPDRSVTYSIRAGPVRQFALTAGDLDVAHDTAGDIAVSVYIARGSGLDAQWIARVAAAALGIFERRFGPYPYRELDLHLLPGDFDGGDEYPGLIFVYSDGPVDNGTRYVTAHEVAHQWWFGLVGNDIYRQPWLDEAFAQYSAIVYAEDVDGPTVAQADWEREVLRRYRGALADGDLPIGLAITSYPNFNTYYRTVYGKGALFLRTLREELGDERFFAALQVYAKRHRYGIATTADVRQAFEDAGGRDLATPFQIWVGD
jgi:aminopeptidase N